MNGRLTNREASMRPTCLIIVAGTYGQVDAYCRDVIATGPKSLSSSSLAMYLGFLLHFSPSYFVTLESTMTRMVSSVSSAVAFVVSMVICCGWLNLNC